MNQSLSEGDNCSSITSGYIDTGRISKAIDIATTRMADIGYKRDEGLKEWETTEHFHPIWLQLMSSETPGKMPISVISKSDKIRSWLSYNPEKKTYRCRICSENFAKFAIDKRLCDEYIATMESKSIHFDRRVHYLEITNHYNSKLHQTIINKLQK